MSQLVFNVSLLIRTLLVTLLCVCQSAFALPEGAINVNSATAEELAESLVGVGQARAEAIVTYRREHGDFIDLDEFMAVQGIGPSVVANNAGKIFFSED